MKILPAIIKRWDFKRRLHEIQQRLQTLDDDLIRQDIASVELEEVLQIVKYWKAHMKGKDDKPKEKKTRRKSVNLWE